MMCKTKRVVFKPHKEAPLFLGFRVFDTRLFFFTLLETQKRMSSFSHIPYVPTKKRAKGRIHALRRVERERERERENKNDDDHTTTHRETSSSSSSLSSGGVVPTRRRRRRRRRCLFFERRASSTKKNDK